MSSHEEQSSSQETSHVSQDETKLNNNTSTTQEIPMLLTVTQASSNNLAKLDSPSHNPIVNNISNNNTNHQLLDEKQNSHHHTRHGSNISGLSNQSNTNHPHTSHHPHQQHQKSAHPITHSNVNALHVDETTTFTNSPLAELLSQMEIYNWEGFVKNMTHYHHGSRTNSFLTNASSATPRDSTPNQVNGHLAPPGSVDKHQNSGLNPSPRPEVHIPTGTTNTMTDIPRMTISKLSRYYSVVLVVRRYVRYGGCGFCNRRIVELVNWFKSLLQIGIIPVVLHAESEEEGNEFFHHFKNPNIAHIPRISDPKYELSSTLLKMNGNEPLVFKELSLIEGLKVFPAYRSAVKDGYTFESDNSKDFEENSKQLVPKMLLIKNNQIVHVWDHGFSDGTPDILSTVVLKLPWLIMTTNDMMSGKTGGDLTDLHTRGSISSNITDMEMRNNYLGIPSNVTRKISSGGSPSRKISNTSNGGLQVPHGSSNSHHYLGTSVESASKRGISSSPSTKGHSPKPQGGNSIQFYLDQLSSQNQQPKNPVVDSTDNEQDAFDVISPTEHAPHGGDTKHLLSTKVQSSEELLIEDIKPEVVDIPELPVGRNTPRSMDSSDTNNMFDLSKLVFKPLTYFRKVAGTLDFEEVDQERLKEEEKHKTQEARELLKKKQNKTFSCFAKQEPIEDYSSDVSTIKMNLQSILLDDDKRKYFKVFAMKEFNAENIFFWEDVHLIYKKIFLDQSTSNEETKEKIESTATYLAGKYFQDEMSLFILNTSNHLKNAVTKSIQSKDYFSSDDCKFLFDDVLLEIMTTVLPDMYYRFIASAQYQIMVKELRRSR